MGSDNLVAFDDLGLARFLLRLLDFVKNVLSHHLIIQLGFAFAVEPEAPHFTFDFALFGGVPIILGPPNTNSSMVSSGSNSLVNSPR